jgi:predicted DNA-binding protein YlxM (UPF0122 family)
MSRGKHLTDFIIQRIVALLRTSELSMPEIATRLSCSRSSVHKINKKFHARLFAGRRTHWKVEL